MARRKKRAAWGHLEPGWYSSRWRAQGSTMNKVYVSKFKISGTSSGWSALVVATACGACGSSHAEGQTKLEPIWLDGSWLELTEA